jgi:AcrR family transcriptional regulator
MQVSDQDIIEVALNLFAEKGYTSVSTREIATAAGITEMTLFRRFESKKNLFLRSVFNECAEAKYPKTLDSISCDDPIEAFHEFVQLMVMSFEKFNLITQIIAHCPEVKDLEFKQMAQERINAARADVERFLGRLVASINAGSTAPLKDIDIPLLALEIISQATGIFFMMSAMEMPTEVCVQAMEDSMIRIRESFQYRAKCGT